MREIGSGWATVSVGDISPDQQYGYTTSASERQDGPQFLRITDIQNGVVDWDHVPYCKVPPRDTEKFAVKDGDILVARTGGTVGKSFLISNVPGTAVFASYLIRLSIKPDVEPRYVYHFFQSADYWRQIGLVKGGLLGNVSATSLASVEIPICPKRQQQRIVSKIDELFSRIDEGERALERVQKLVERYRQSVLKAAVTGELTREWRETNADKLESGEALLSRILDARRAAWEKDELDKMKAKGVKPANDKWKERYVERAAPDTADLPELPKGWVWATLDQLSYLITSGSRGWSEYYNERGSLFVRAQNIKHDVLDLDDIAFVNLTGVTEGTRTKVALNDILVTITGANVTKAARVTVELESAFVSQHVALVRPAMFEISPYLFNWIISSANGRADLLKAAYGAGKPGLSLEDLKELTVAVPPQLEQDTICDRLDVEFSRIDSIAFVAKSRANSVFQLRQSVLKRAFLGELVHQDPTDEPAFVLLERIAVQSSQTVSGAKLRRARKSKA
ncbi:MAG: restriction endonuclease subunit S [Gemmatimonas sp.]